MEGTMIPNWRRSVVATRFGPLALAGWVVIAAGCGGGDGGGGSCEIATRGLAQGVFCRKAHDCRTSFALTDGEFAAIYGEDLVACFDGASLPEVDAVMTHAPSPEPPPFVSYDAPEMLFWRLLTNCLDAVSRATCEVAASGVLLEDGNYCGDDVMQGVVEAPSDLGNGECYETLYVPDAGPGNTADAQQ